MRQRFIQKTALVTGASSGVGRAVAVALANEGASVSLLGRREVELKATAALIGTSVGRALPVVADVQREEEIDEAVRMTREAFGEIDILVNAAGVLRLGILPTFSMSDWDELFNTNVKGAFVTARAVLPQMQVRRTGAIVNVSSVFAFAASSGSAAYSASKAALTALTKIMAIDHIADGIRVNCVAPGALDTPMLTSFARSVSPNDPDSVMKAAAELNPIGRLIRAEEVAALVLYLLSDEAEAIVGSTFTIDGGRLAILGSAKS